MKNLDMDQQFQTEAQDWCLIKYSTYYVNGVYVGFDAVDFVNKIVAAIKEIVAKKPYVVNLVINYEITHTLINDPNVRANPSSINYDHFNWQSDEERAQLDALSQSTSDQKHRARVVDHQALVEQIFQASINLPTIKSNHALVRITLKGSSLNDFPRQWGANSKVLLSPQTYVKDIARNHALRDQLHKAAIDGDFKSFQTTAAQGVNIFSKTGKEGNTPLHWAASFGRRNIVSFILEKIFSFNINFESNHRGIDAFELAGMNGHIDTVEVFRMHFIKYIQELKRKFVAVGDIKSDIKFASVGSSEHLSMMPNIPVTQQQIQHVENLLHSVNTILSIHNNTLYLTPRSLLMVNENVFCINNRKICFLVLNSHANDQVLMDQHAIALANIIKRTRLFSIRVIGEMVNHVGAWGVRCLADAIQLNHSLTHLDLGSFYEHAEEKQQSSLQQTGSVERIDPWLFQIHGKLTSQKLEFARRAFIFASPNTDGREFGHEKMTKVPEFYRYHCHAHFKNCIFQSSFSTNWKKLSVLIAFIRANRASALRYSVLALMQTILAYDNEAYFVASMIQKFVQNQPLPRLLENFYTLPPQLADLKTDLPCNALVMETKIHSDAAKVPQIQLWLASSMLKERQYAVDHSNFLKTLFSSNELDLFGKVFVNFFNQYKNLFQLLDVQIDKLCIKINVNTKHLEVASADQRFIQSFISLFLVLQRLNIPLYILLEKNLVKAFNKVDSLFLESDEKIVSAADVSYQLSPSASAAASTTVAPQPQQSTVSEQTMRELRERLSELEDTQRAVLELIEKGRGVHHRNLDVKSAALAAEIKEYAQAIQELEAGSPMVDSENGIESSRVVVPQKSEGSSSIDAKSAPNSVIVSGDQKDERNLTEVDVPPRFISAPHAGMATITSKSVTGVGIGNSHLPHLKIRNLIFTDPMAFFILSLMGPVALHRRTLKQVNKNWRNFFDREDIEQKVVEHYRFHYRMSSNIAGSFFVGVVCALRQGLTPIDAAMKLTPDTPTEKAAAAVVTFDQHRQCMDEIFKLKPKYLGKIRCVFSEAVNKIFRLELDRDRFVAGHFALVVFAELMSGQHPHSFGPEYLKGFIGTMSEDRIDMLINNFIKMCRSDANKVTVRVWLPPQGSGDVGHVSLQTHKGGFKNEPIYASIWPKNKVAASAIFNEHEMKFNRNVDEDEISETRPADHTIELFDLDPQLINSHFTEFVATKTTNWNIFSISPGGFSCSGLVKSLLFMSRMSGGDKWALLGLPPELQDAPDRLKQMRAGLHLKLIGHFFEKKNVWTPTEVCELALYLRDRETYLETLIRYCLSPKFRKELDAENEQKAAQRAVETSCALQ